MTLVAHLYQGTSGSVPSAAALGASGITGLGGHTLVYNATGLVVTNIGSTGNSNGISWRTSLPAPDVNLSNRYRFVFLSALPTVPLDLRTFRWASGVNCKYLVKSDGIWVSDTANAITQFMTATEVSAAGILGAEIEIEVIITGGSTTASQLVMNLYKANTTLVKTKTITGMNMTVNQFATYDTGLLQATSTNTYSIEARNDQINNGSTAGIPTYSGPINVVPSVTVQADQDVSIGATVTVSSTATDGDGTVVSRQWTWLEYPGTTPPSLGSSATTATASFVPTQQGAYVLAFTATDNSGGTSGQAIHTAYAAGSSILVRAISTNTGGWVTTSAANLNDVSDTTYIESPPAPTGSEKVVRYLLQPLLAFSSFGLIDRDGVSAAGTNASYTRLLEGTTVRKEWQLTLTTTPTDYPLSLSSGEIAAIGSRRALILEFAYTGS